MRQGGTSCRRHRGSHKGLNVSDGKHAPAPPTAATATCRARTTGVRCAAAVYTRGGPWALPGDKVDPAHPGCTAALDSDPPSSVPAQDPPEGHPRVQGAHGRECQVHQRFPPPRRSPEAQGHSLRGPLPKARPAKSTLLARWGDRVSRGRGWLTFMFCSSHTMNHPSWCQPVYF